MGGDVVYSSKNLEGSRYNGMKVRWMWSILPFHAENWDHLGGM